MHGSSEPALTCTTVSGLPSGRRRKLRQRLLDRRCSARLPEHALARGQRGQRAGGRPALRRLVRVREGREEGDDALQRARAPWAALRRVRQQAQPCLQSMRGGGARVQGCTRAAPRRAR